MVPLVGFEIPKARVPLPADVMDRMLVRRLPGHEGVGALLAGMLTRLVRGTAGYRSSDGPRLETVPTDPFTAVRANQTETRTGCRRRAAPRSSRSASGRSSSGT
ncbi:hypothetical protein [Streptomyces hebeiensis]